MNNNNRLFIMLLIQTVSFTLIASIVVIGNTVLVYAKESSSEKSSGADSGNNNNNPSPQLSATPSRVCNSNQNNSACQEPQQLQVKQPDQQQPAKPDDSCLFHPEQMKCKPDPITSNCPTGFSMNVNQHCYPNKPCPNGFERHEDDETGACYPIHEPISNQTLASK